MTPTQRSLKKLRDEGWTVEVVEKWNAHARIRQDLFGFIDLIAIKEGQTLAVQTTSYGNVSARCKKIAEHENTPIVRSAGWLIHVHGWRKVGNRWQCREVDVS